MKGRTLDHVVAAARDHRSVALATDLTTGRQLLLDGEQVEGDLALDDAPLDQVREAWRSGRNRTIETASGPVFVEVLTPPHRCFIVGAVHIAQPLARMLVMTDYAVTIIDPREILCDRGALSRHRNDVGVAGRSARTVEAGPWLGGRRLDP